MELQDRLDAFKAKQKDSGFPPAFRETINRMMAALIASGQETRALTVGDEALGFELPQQDGTPVSSHALLANGPLVVTFYRGVWCSYCNLELKALQAALPNIVARGASLVAISQQTPVNNRKSRRDNGLEFPILSDKGGEVGAAYGLRWAVPDDMRAVHQQLGSPLPLFNGEDSWTLPMPARYVIGQDGVIAYAEVNADYTARPDPGELMPVLDRLAVRKGVGDRSGR